MIFLKCLIRGFGKLEQRTLQFQPGLNVLFAPNEGGKSTLQRFLLAMLYGPLRSDVRTQRRLEPWVDQYRPWSGADYGGILWCGTAGGRELEISRNLSRDDNRFEIRTLTGEDISGQYEQQRNGDVLFAKAHLGMSRELFEAVAVVRENRAGEVGGHDSIRERIANLAQSGDEELSIRLSLEKLEQALEEIGSDRAPTRPYRQTMERIDALQAEMRALSSRRTEFQGWVEERNSCSAALAVAGIDARDAARVALSARRNHAAVRVRTLEELERDIRSLDSQIEESGGNPAFPSEHLEELDQLAGAQESVEMQLAELRRSSSTKLPELAAARERRAQLAEYETLCASGNAEKITEWLVSYMSATFQKDNAQRAAARLSAELQAVESAVAALGSAAADADADWETRARQASEREGEYSRKILEVASKAAGLKALGAEHAAFRTRHAVAGIVALAAGVLLAALGFFQAPAAVFVGSGTAALIASGVFFAQAGKRRRAMLEAASGRAMLEQEQKALQDVAGQAKSEIMSAAANSGFASLDQFLAACRQALQYREKSGHLKARLAEAEADRDRSNAEVNELYGRLKQTLAGVNLSCSPASLKSQVDVLRANLRQYRELDARYRVLDQTLSRLDGEESELAANVAAREAAIGRILDTAAVPTLEKYRECCRAKQRVIELQERRSSRAREFQRLCLHLDIEQWRTRLAELDVAAGRAGADRIDRTDAPGPHAPRLPYLPGIEEAEADEKRAAERLSEAREAYAVAAEKVRHAFEGYRTVSEIEEDLATARREFRELDLNRRALTVAIDTIRELSRQQQESLAPQLNQAVERRFVRLCAERYSEVRIDPDFQIRVREAATGDLRQLDSLSRGTQDQLYFALRFGVLDLVSTPGEPSPCLLDEPFAAYDANRLREALGVLREEAAFRQILLFTCREDLHTLASRSGHSIPL